MMILLVVFVLILLVLLVLFFDQYKETFSLGAMDQMYARGLIDSYLFGDTFDICGDDPLCLMDEPVKKSQNRMFY